MICKSLNESVTTLSQSHSSANPDFVKFLKLEKDLEESRLKNIEHELLKPFKKEHITGIRNINHLASREYGEEGRAG